MSTSNTTVSSADVGHTTLDVIASAEAFNRWMYDVIAPHCKGLILEIGSGIGNISKFFIREKKNIVLTELREDYCDIVRKTFSQTSPDTRIEQMDLVDDNFNVRYAHLLGQFDTVFALNVVEHIEDDSKAIANIHSLLRKDGRIVILVPAYQFLYNNMDRGLEHFRRYTRKRLTKLIAGNGFEIKNSFYFNSLGILGWFVSGSLMKSESIPGGQMKLFNMMVIIAKILDAILMRNVGLSVVAVGTKS